MEPVQTMENALVILNPMANRGQMQHIRDLVRSRASVEGAEYSETQAAGQAETLARQAADQGRSVIIVGGDGTLHEGVNGLLASQKKVGLGIVAAGSGNDFAWNTLQLPHDPAQALERAFHGRLTAVDAGRVNGRYFANAFSVGLDADIAEAAQHLRRWPLMSGQRLYYSATLKQLLFGYHRCPWLSFTLDGAAPHARSRYILLAVNNGPTYGAGFRINPTADHTDGLFAVCAIRYTPLLRALRLLPVVKRGEHQQIPEATFLQARVIQIESQDPVQMQMDGETMLARRFQAEILPGALWVRV